MTKITYHIVEHDGGWAYQVNGVFSETFPSMMQPRRRRSAPPRSSTCRETPELSPGKIKVANGTKNWRAATIGPRPKSRAEILAGSDRNAHGSAFGLDQRTKARRRGDLPGLDA